MNNSERINGFDALRTIAMWLGIVLHAIIVYKVTPEPSWPHDTQINIYFLDWLYTYIHTFRMPLFFLVAGFFARFVIIRSGVKYFITQRFRRIVIPFIIGIIVIIPVSLLPFNYYKFYYVQQFTMETAWHKSLIQMFKWNGLAHLWFLYYMIFFYALSLAAKFIVNKLRYNLTGKCYQFMENISLIKLLAASSILFFILLYNQASVPPVYTGIKPNIVYLLYYGFFYACGWLIQINIKSITSLTNNCWLMFITGTGLSILQFWKGNWSMPVLEYLVTAIQTISLIAGITGLFIKFFHSENKLWRYCSDATYWIYLTHLCIVASVQVVFLNSSFMVWLRLPVVIVVTFSLTLLSYHFFVRYTVIGEYLHGKRTRPKKMQ